MTTPRAMRRPRIIRSRLRGSGQAAWRLGVSIREYRKLEAGSARVAIASARGDRSDGEAEDQRYQEHERRHPDEKGALARFGGERIQLVSLTSHFSFAFHA
jgi:hypothetical protein